jgi:hypothetical protein
MTTPTVKVYDIRCGECINASPARGSLGGIWLFCDHPESFKRYVHPHQTCECAFPRATATDETGGLAK